MRVLMRCSFVIWENCTRKWELQCTLAVYTAFKSESNAIEFTKGELDNMDAGLQALRSSSGHLASVEINGIKCSQVIMVASSVTLV